MNCLRIRYKVVDGVDIPTDIYIPRAAPTGRAQCPVLLVLHGGGFMLGHAKMNNKAQIEDCLDRGWIVLSLEYRLCPGVNVLEGPMSDTRDAYEWARMGGLAEALQNASFDVQPDVERIMAMGASAGGHLALSLAWTTKYPPLAILDFYGAKNFKDPFWHEPIEQIRSKLPPVPSSSIFDHLLSENTTFVGGVSLEGQGGESSQGAAPPPPDFSDLRQLFALSAIGNGKVLEAIWPKTPNDLHLIDPVLNLHDAWPPTAMVHGNADFMIPIGMSRHFDSLLKQRNIETELIEVEGEPHTFLGKMEKGSRTWHTQRRGFDFLERVLQRSYT